MQATMRASIKAMKIPTKVLAAGLLMSIFDRLSLIFSTLKRLYAEIWRAL